MTDAINTPQKGQYHIITFSWGQPEQTLRITNWDSDIPLSPTETVLSLPGIEIDLAPNTGVFGEDPTELKLQLVDNPAPGSAQEAVANFLDPLTRGTPFAQVHVSVEEVIDPTNIGDSGSRQFVESGLIYRTRRNADRKTGLVVIEVRNRKGLLDVSLGFQCNPHCTWRINGPGCNENTHGPSGFVSRSANITINGTQITVSDPGLVFDMTDTRSWTRGYVTFGGVQIGIFYYDKAQDGQTTKVFNLVRQPPEEWASELIVFFPGCTKQLDGSGGCRLAWDNEEGFGGSGLAIPRHHPITENPNPTT